MADDMAALMDALDIKKTHVCGVSMGGMIVMEFALRHPGRLDRMILAGAPGAPARAAFHPVMTWNWVKANDKTGEIFACQQFTWLFSSAFLRNREAVQQTVAMLSSNPNPVGPHPYNRQAQALLRFDVLDRLAGVKAPTSASSASKICSRQCTSAARSPTRFRARQVRSDQGRRLVPPRADRASGRLQRPRHEVPVLND
jgi:pimeloyl-ACP methyl ester carboxylesterase